MPFPEVLEKLATTGLTALVSAAGAYLLSRFYFSKTLEESAKKAADGAVAAAMAQTVQPALAAWKSEVEAMKLKQEFQAHSLEEHKRQYEASTSEQEGQWRELNRTLGQIEGEMKGARRGGGNRP